MFYLQKACSPLSGHRGEWETLGLPWRLCLQRGLSGVPSLCFCSKNYSSKFWDNLISITHYMVPAPMWVNTYMSEWESGMSKTQGPYQDKRRVAKSLKYLYWHILTSCVASKEERLVLCLLPTQTSFMFCPVGHLACFLLHTQCWAFISGDPFWFYQSWLLPL